jgi:hypothetical protein
MTIVWIVLFVAVLLAVGLMIDRRHGAGNALGLSPSERSAMRAERSRRNAASGGGFMGYYYGGGDGGGGFGGFDGGGGCGGGDGGGGNC